MDSSSAQAPAAHPAPRTLPSPRRAAVAIGLLLGLQPTCTDLYMPALPAIAQAFGAGMPLVQMTMSALILGFGAAQLLWGPVADRYGRRPVLLAGLLLLLLAGLACVAAPDIGVLVAARALQGIGLAAAVVCGRAMVRDLYEPARGAHVMSQGLSGLGVIAVVAPVVGGTLVVLGGWRAPLAAVAAMALAALAFVALLLPETLPPERRQPLRFAPLWANSAQVLRHPTFIAWAGLVAASYGGLFTLLSASSFVYIGRLGLSARQYGLVMALACIAYLAGTVACRRWLPALGLRGVVRRGGVIALAGGLSMAALALAGVQTVWAVLLPQAVFNFAHGLQQPCGQSGCTGPFPHAAGVAAALAGFLLALVAFAIGLWLGFALDGTTRPLALSVAFWSVVTALIGRTLVQRHGGA